jgi:hypothetical protein
MQYFELTPTHAHVCTKNPAHKHLGHHRPHTVQVHCQLVSFTGRTQTKAVQVSFTVQQRDKPL